MKLNCKLLYSWTCVGFATKERAVLLMRAAVLGRRMLYLTMTGSQSNFPGTLMFVLRRSARMMWVVPEVEPRLVL